MVPMTRRTIAYDHNDEVQGFTFSCLESSLDSRPNRMAAPISLSVVIGVDPDNGDDDEVRRVGVALAGSPKPTFTDF